MESNTKMPQKSFYSIIIACAVIICCESLQAITRVRNPNNYVLWLETFGQQIDFDLYMTIQLSFFFGRVITPMLLGIYTYIAFVKVRIGKMFVGVWTLILLGNLLQIISEWDSLSILYCCKSIAYVIAILTIMKLWKVIEESRLIKEG